MAEGSNSNAATSSADTAARLYPSGSENQSQGASAPANGSPKPASPYVVTNMTDGKTIYVDPNTGKSFEMETRNDIMPDSESGADDPYFGRITSAEINRNKKLGPSFGTAKIYTDDVPRGRIIHGGGHTSNKALVSDPFAPRQGWVPTYGCTRGQNEDVEKMAGLIQQFQKDHPKVPILYYRVRPDDQDE